MSHGRRGLVSSLLLAAILSAVWIESAIVLAAVAALYALFVTAVALSAASPRSIGLAAQTGLAIAIMHVGYGVGFIVGFVRFAGRWRLRRQVTPADGQETEDRT